MCPCRAIFIDMYMLNAHTPIFVLVLEKIGYDNSEKLLSILNWSPLTECVKRWSTDLGTRFRAALEVEIFPIINDISLYIAFHYHPNIFQTETLLKWK